MNIPFNMTNKGITVFVDGKPCSFATDHPSHDDLRAAIHAGDEDKVRELADVRGHIKTRTLGRVSILENSILIDGREVSGRLVQRILEMVRLGSVAVDGYVRFLDNLHRNPSKRAVDELWGFIEACDLPVTSDGHFMAYRFVNGDYMDSYSRTVSNKPAALMSDSELAEFTEDVIGGMRKEVTTKVVDGVTTISCERNMVDEDKDRTCSAGLHFCSHGYLPSYGMGMNHRRVLAVKINPADVVAIPSDHANQKGRTCHYTVMNEIDDWDANQITPFYTDEYDDLDDDLLDVDLLDDDDLDDDLLDDEDDVPPVEAYEDSVPVASGPTLNVAQVQNILALLRDRPDLTMTAIAAQYGVHRETIARIRDGRAWAHVSPAAVAVWPVKFTS